MGSGVSIVMLLPSPQYYIWDAKSPACGIEECRFAGLSDIATPSMTDRTSTSASRLPTSVLLIATQSTGSIGTGSENLGRRRWRSPASNSTDGCSAQPSALPAGPCRNASGGKVREGDASSSVENLLLPVGILLAFP
jgi:hypothetical protein